MPEWRKSFEAEDSDFADPGAMEVYSSTEMDAPSASRIGNARPRTQSRRLKQTLISPGKSDQVRRFTLTVCRISRTDATAQPENSAIPRLARRHLPPLSRGGNQSAKV